MAEGVRQQHLERCGREGSVPRQHRTVPCKADRVDRAGHRTPTLRDEEVNLPNKPALSRKT